MIVAFPKSVLPAVLAAMALASACATAPLTLDDDLIVPGDRVGEVEIGMPLSTLLALKGNPLRTAPISDTEATTYSFDGLTVGADDEVYWIIAHDPKFHTGGGVAPGVEQIFARASFGKPACVVTRDDVTIYDYGNIYFDVENSTGKVRQVGVLKKTSICRQ
jgi:hypothetical protein